VKNLYIKSYGCQMNVYDSERMAEILAPLGYRSVAKPEEADLIILNTCHIREKATEKVYSDLGRLKEIKDSKKDAAGLSPLIAVAGCTAQAEGEEIMKRAKYVDMVFGPQTYHQLPQMLAEIERRHASFEGPGRGILNIDFPAEVKFDHLPEITHSQGVATFLSIQEGCDKFCHFCVVPYTRGAEYSRPVASVLKDAKLLVSQGVREITLLGQNVNAYHGEAPQGKITWGLGKLICALAEIEGLERIRYTTSHPRDVDQELIDAHRDIKKLMPYLHLPVQSGSDKILKAMNRKHTKAEYLAIIARFRKACPELAFSSDFIVGYPGEEEKDFQETLELVQEVGYAQAYSFKYSPRPGTPASMMENQVPEDIKMDRLERLQEILKIQQRDFNQRMVGKVLSILWEKPGRHAGQLVGRSPYLQAVHAHVDPTLKGKISNVEIIGASLNSLTGHSPSSFS
jgi:tRNA-2-methylthio-N6-dimethylallyladenosine synthase